MFTHKELLAQSDRLKKFALRLTRNESDASDLLQSTYLRALTKNYQFEGGTNLFSWSSKIMYNLFVTSYWRRVKFEAVGNPDVYINNASIAANQDINCEMRDVENAMKLLHPDHYEVLVMICVKGMSYEEVSNILMIKLGTVKSRLSRAREQLQVALDKPKPKNIAYFKNNGIEVEVAA